MFGGKFRGLLGVVAAMWGTFLLDRQFDLGLIRYGIAPRDFGRIGGVLLWPLLHANLTHLLNNTLTLVTLGGIISAKSSSRSFLALSLRITIYAGLGVWLVGRPAAHVGASGLVFGYFGYIITRGLYDGRLASIGIASVVIVFFGGMIWGVLPTDGYVSWEGHLLGLLSGAVLAFRVTGRRYA